MKLLVGMALASLALLPRPAAAQASQLGDPSSPSRVEGEAELAVPEPPAPALDAERAELLEDWLEHAARSEEVLTYVATIPGITVGAAGVGFAVWAWATGAGGALGDPAFGLVVGNASFALGGLLLGLSIYALADAGVFQRRLARFRGERAGMSSEGLARFEGELRSDAEQAAAGRRVLLGLGVTVAVLSAPIVIASAAMQDVADGARIGGYALAGTFAVLGGAMIALSFVTTPEERVWAAYQRREGPRAGLTVTPQVGLGSLGLAGTF